MAHATNSMEETETDKLLSNVSASSSLEEKRKCDAKTIVALRFCDLDLAIVGQELSEKPPSDHNKLLQQKVHHLRVSAKIAFQNVVSDDNLTVLKADMGSNAENLLYRVVYVDMLLELHRVEQARRELIAVTEMALTLLMRPRSDLSTADRAGAFLLRELFQLESMRGLLDVGLFTSDVCSAIRHEPTAVYVAL